jgi:aspartate racemase
LTSATEEGVLGTERLESTSEKSRCLGLIGGLGPGATVYYYRGLLAAHQSAGRTARLLIAHADIDCVRRFMEKDDRAGLARYLAGFVSSLAAGGAEMTAIVAITPHICVSELKAISPLPLIDIVSEVAAAIRTRGLKRIALLGTRFTVESRMFDRLGVEVVVPKPEEIDQIHNVYMDVVHDRSTPGQIDGLRQVARTFVERDGAEAVLLAGTDLSMVLNEDNAGFPTIDCAATHIKAITERLLG